MSLCKTSLEKIGKAAFNSLSEEDKLKYTTASTIVTIITDIAASGNIPGAIADVGLKLTNVGLQLGSAALITLASSISGKEITTLSGALQELSSYVLNAVSKLLDQIKHDIANKLAVLFGIEENPGIIGAIMEFVYKVIVQPALA